MTAAEAISAIDKIVSERDRYRRLCDGYEELLAALAKDWSEESRLAPWREEPSPQALADERGDAKLEAGRVP